MLLGYVTNGFAYHGLDDAIAILAEVGYRAVAITLDRFHLNPFCEDWPGEARRVRQLLEGRGMQCTVETGARFLLDARRKHFPTLISRDASARDRRIAFLCRCVDVASELEANAVSLWSGAPDEPDAEDDEVLFDRLCDGLRDVLQHAEEHGIPLAFEPEPHMFIETMDNYARLHKAIGHELFGLTLDVGHVHCLGDGDLLEHARRWRRQLCNVHIEDMRRGEHEHLFFGEGEMNFTETLGILRAVEYAGPVHVELSRHSHNAPDTAAQAYRFLSDLWPK